MSVEPSDAVDGSDSVGDAGPGTSSNADGDQDSPPEVGSSVDSSTSGDEGFKMPTLLAAKSQSAPDSTSSSTAGQRHRSEQPSASSSDQSALPAPLTTVDPPPNAYFVEVLKNGNIVQKLAMNHPRFVFGRARECDLPMDHPSISRFHAALLYKESLQDPSRGFFYVMDLNSTHGTTLNKEKLAPGKVVKVTVNNCIIQLGGSSRKLMLSGVDDEDDGVSSTQSSASSSAVQDEEVCSWGMREFAVDEEDEAGEPVSLHSRLTAALAAAASGPTPNHQAYTDSSQKVLSQWFDREGYDFEYAVDFKSNKFTATIRLPTEADDVVVTGEPQVRKKEAIADACLRCCQLLDRAEQLFPWQQQKAATKRRGPAGSDEEDMLDETDEARRKRARRELIQAKLNQHQNQQSSKSGGVETHESLKAKWDTISDELRRLKARLAELSVRQAAEQPTHKGGGDDDEEDALDMFMNSLASSSSGGEDRNRKIEQSRLKKQIADLERQQCDVERLLQIAKPDFQLPSASTSASTSHQEATEAIAEPVQSTSNSNNGAGHDQEPSTSSSSAHNRTSVASAQPSISEVPAPGPSSPSGPAQAPSSSIKPIQLLKKPPVANSRPSSSFSPPLPPLTRPHPSPSSSGASSSTSSRSSLSAPDQSSTIRPSARPPAQPSKARPLDSVASVISRERQQQQQQNPPGAAGSSADDYIDWVPPTSQTGDGTTALNKKLGY